MNDKEQMAFDGLTPPKEGAGFTLERVSLVCSPHPYCITPRHVAFAADHCSGRLTGAAIKDSKARCGIQGCNLDYSEHEALLTAVIRVPQNDDLNDVPGLHAYLLSVKKEAEGLGFDGFAFPGPGQ